MAEFALILIVDDDEALRETLAHSLIDAGYRVLKAKSGDEAVALAGEFHPDLILLDVMMPGLSGFETARIIRNNPPTTSIPILFLSGEARDVSSIEEGFKLGADDYMTKGQSTKEILLRINRTIQRNRQSHS